MAVHRKPSGAGAAALSSSVKMAQKKKKKKELIPRSKKNEKLLSVKKSNRDLSLSTSSKKKKFSSSSFSSLLGSNKKGYHEKEEIGDEDDEEILSDDAEGILSEDDEVEGSHSKNDRKEIDPEDSDFPGETPDEKRLRVAKKYLEELTERTRGKARKRRLREEEEEDEEDEEEALGILLRREASGKRATDFETRHLSSQLRLKFSAFLRGHRLPVTCVCTPGKGDVTERLPSSSLQTSLSSSLDRHVYTGAKDCCIICWDLQEEKKTIFQGRRNDFHCGGHFQPIYGLCVAPDESFFCSVGKDQLVRIWDPRSSTTKCVAALRGHTGSIRGVKFNRWSSSLGLDTLGSATGDIEIVTCGEDKSVKLWNLGVHACMDSFYGHTSPITSMDIIQPNKPLTVGEDNTARLWKLQQDTHLVFTPQLSSLDSCALLSPSLFACGDSRGLVSLYSTLKKKPLASQLLHARQRSSYPLLFPPSSSSSCSDTHQPDKKEEEKTKEAMMKMIWRNGKKDLSSERKAGEKSHSSSSVLAGGGVSSLVALRQSDVFFTGSESGNISMWSITGRAQRTGGEEEEKNGLAKKKKNRFHNDEEDMNGGRKKPSSSSNFSESVGLYQTSQGFDFPHGGVVAGLAVSPSERFLIAAISKESRFGRWIVEKDVRNGIALIELEKED